MTRQTKIYNGPMTPVTPALAEKLNSQEYPTRQRRLLPSALEMTPPQSIPHKQNRARPQSSFEGRTRPISAPDQLTGHNQQFSLSPYSMPQSSIGAQMGLSMGAQMGHHYTTSMGTTVGQPLGASMGASMGQSATPQGPSMGTSMAQGMLPFHPIQPVSPFYPRSYFGVDASPIRGNSYPLPEEAYHTLPNSVNMPPPPNYMYPRITPTNFPSGRISKQNFKNPELTRTVYKSTEDIYEAYNNYILRQSGEDKSKVIWPPEIEVVFMEALWLIPGSLRKITIDQKSRGRNELIADYITTVTGQVRSRKQVSSHLQVLKKLLKSDSEFLDIVGPKRDEKDEKTRTQRSVSNLPEMSVSGLSELVVKLRKFMEGKQKPRFLLQAEYNAEYAKPVVSTDFRAKSMMDSMSADVYSQPAQVSQVPQASQGVQSAQPQVPQGAQTAQGGQGSTLPLITNNNLANIPRRSIDSSHRYENTSKTNGMPKLEISKDPQHPNVNLDESKSIVDENPPPLKYPKPMHLDTPTPTNLDALIEPAASVPPQEGFEFPHNIVSMMNFQAHNMSNSNRKHRRTVSANVEMFGDKVLPSQFVICRRKGDQAHMYTRLLRACYESPSRPLQLNRLLPHYPHLEVVLNNDEFNDIQFIHGTVMMDVKPIEGHYHSDVQFMVTKNESITGSYRYIVRTVVTSRQIELLSCDSNCISTSLSGRGLEQDKELISIPYLPDFWSDFLSRIENKGKEYMSSALGALAMTQIVYRKTQHGEEPCFVALYQFQLSQDEFSARTRFRRVEHGTPIPEFDSPLKLRNFSVVDQPDIGSPRHGFNPTIGFPLTGAAGTGHTSMATSGHTVGSTSGNDSNGLSSVHTTKGTSTTSNTGATGTTTGTTTGTLSFPQFTESPGFNSPRRLNDKDFGLSPFTAASRGSPRALREIPRSLTAFEPASWDEFPDWVCQ